MYRVMNRYANLPHLTRLEAPSLKGAECRVIKNDISCAFKHSSGNDVPGLLVNFQKRDATTGEVSLASFNWIIWTWRVDRNGFASWRADRRRRRSAHLS